MKPLFIIEGRVQTGKKRGKRLGFPTINFPVDKKLPEGIYISQTKIRRKIYPSLTFIGTAKTYGETVFQAETYILDFGEDIYEESIRIHLLKKIRDNKKFDSETELIKQMKKDKKQSVAYFKD